MMAYSEVRVGVGQFGRSVGNVQFCSSVKKRNKKNEKQLGY